MQLKDAMRETCLLDLAEAWYNLLRAYQSANPELAAAVLSTVQRYVNWIDVSLVVNERSVGSLLQLECHVIVSIIMAACCLTAVNTAVDNSVLSQATVDTVLHAVAGASA